MNEIARPIARPRFAEAEAIARRLPQVLARRGLRPVFSDWLLASHQGLVWLFGVLDVDRLSRLEAYTHDDLLHHLSTAIGGRPVFVSNTSGLRYAVLLSPIPRLPRRVDFPGLERGELRLGLRAQGYAAAPWASLGHLLVAGMTGSGKSGMLRLIVHQAIAEGFRMLVADLDGATFPMLADHPALLAPIARTPAEAAGVVARALGECDHRAQLYAQTPGFPESLEEYQAQGEPLPRLLVVLDEFNATVTALGGPGKTFAADCAALGWRGRKFGVNIIFAAQDFAKSVVGRVRDQVGAAICFRVRSVETARAVGCAGAERIPASLPGRAVTDRWGPIQTFYLDKSLLTTGALLTEEEAALGLRALAEAEGRLSIPQLKAWGWRERAARALVEEWEARGWLRRDPGRDNARYITPVLADILSNRQTGQTASNRSNRIAYGGTK